MKLAIGLLGIACMCACVTPVSRSEFKAECERLHAECGLAKFKDGLWNAQIFMPRCDNFGNGYTVESAMGQALDKVRDGRCEYGGDGGIVDIEHITESR